MRLSVAPERIACAGYKPEPPRRPMLTAVGAIVGMAVIYYALTTIFAGWAALIMEIAK